MRRMIDNPSSGLYTYYEIASHIPATICVKLLLCYACDYEE